MDHSVVKYLLVSLNMCCVSNSNITVISIIVLHGMIKKQYLKVQIFNRKK